MTPLQAAAVLVLPSFLTNVWQAAVGPSLMSAVRRLWPMLLGICLGTWAGAGFMTGANSEYGRALLGGALVIYAATGFRATQVTIQKAHELWLGPVAGALTGLITGATGVSVIPVASYLQSIGLEKEELVQALGLSFTVSMLALTANIARAGALNVAVAAPAVVALAAACAGMWIGQILRVRLSPAIFRSCFFVGLFLLGTYLIVAAAV